MARSLIIIIMFALASFGRAAEVPVKFITAAVGQSIILPCFSSSFTELDPSAINAYWQRTDREVVHFTYNGEVDFLYQSKNYKGRASTFPGELSRGNFSLNLAQVRLEDIGQYETYINFNNKIKLECRTQLSVGESFSNPAVTVSQCVEDAASVRASCCSGGGFPEPVVQWKFQNGSRVLGEETVVSPQGLKNHSYDVVSHVWVNTTPGQVVICTVTNPTLLEAKHTPFTIQKCPPGEDTWTATVTVSVVVPAVVVIAVVAAFLIMKKKSPSQRMDHRLESVSAADPEGKTQKLLQGIDAEPPVSPEKHVLSGAKRNGFLHCL